MTRSGKIIRLLLLLLVLAGVLPFFLPWQKPLLSWHSLSLPSLPDVKVKLPELPELPEASPGASADKSVDSQQVTVYRWRDQQGGWHFSNEAPQQGVAYEKMMIDPDTNLLQGQPQQDPAQGKGTTQTTENGGGYTAEELMQLKQKAEEAKKALEQRYREQEQRLQQLR